METKPPLPPFTLETAKAKVQAALVLGIEPMATKTGNLQLMV
jgi:hypothetical protein